MKDVVTKRFTSDDFETLLTWITSEAELKQWAGPALFTWPLTQEQLNNYLLRMTEQAPAAKLYSMYLDTSLIGHFGLDPINWDDKTAILQRVITAPDCRGLGYGIHLINVALQHAFNEFELQEVCLKVYTFNTPAIACYLKTGFEILETVKNACLVNNQSWDMLVMSIKTTKYIYPSSKSKE